MQISELPFFERLKQRRRVLIAGMGGGFDVFCGLPLFFDLRSEGTQVFLANLTFSNTQDVSGFRPHPAVLEVTKDTTERAGYFPELHLTKWLYREGAEASVFCVQKAGYPAVEAAYKGLAAQLEPDAVVLVDGGTDGLMRGDETGLGTPHEDMLSLAAAQALDVPVKLVACLGFGIDAYHGVSHALFLENVADLHQSRGAAAPVSGFVHQVGEPQRALQCSAVTVNITEHNDAGSVSAWNGVHE